MAGDQRRDGRVEGGGAGRSHPFAREAVPGVERLDVGRDRLGEGNGRGPPLDLRTEEVAGDELGDEVVRAVVPVRRVPVDQALERVGPGHGGRLFTDDGEGAVGGQDPTEAGQDHLPVHPVEAGTGGDQGVGGTKRDLLGGTVEPGQVGMVPAGGAAAEVDHRPRNVDGVDPVDDGGERAGELSGAAADVEEGPRLVDDQGGEEGEELVGVGRAVAVGGDHALVAELGGVVGAEVARFGEHAGLLDHAGAGTRGPSRRRRCRRVASSRLAIVPQNDAGPTPPRPSNGPRGGGAGARRSGPRG